MSIVGPTIADLGEHEVLKRLRPYCAAVVGDDAAIQPMPAGEQLVVTTDVLVDGVHFSDRTLSPCALGWRAAAVNLSDLAAMGAHPLGLTIGMTLPPNTSWSWVEALYQGIADCLGHYGGEIMGGDLCRGEHRSLAITALGYVSQYQALYRNRALAQQTLVVTGVHGSSRAGLAVLLEEIEVTGALAQAWVQVHQHPLPRFDAIAILRTQTKTMVNIAAMDTSDGLADAVIQICRQSGVGAALLRSQLPMPPGLIDVVGPVTAQHWTLYGGEDFELVLSLPPELANAFIERLPGSQMIGQTTEDVAIRLIDDVDQGPDVLLDQNQGYRHF